MKLFCPDCGAQYESGNFCQECGAKLQEMKPQLVCPSCGHKASSGKFCCMCGHKLIEQYVVPTLSAETTTPMPKAKDAMKPVSAMTSASGGGSCLPMDEIRKAANARYSKPSLKALAVGALKVAEVIAERLPDADVSYMVHPSEFAAGVSEKALPVHFLFRKAGRPAVAVVMVTANGYKATHVMETAEACKQNGIRYVRVFAEGCYADWIVGTKYPGTYSAETSEPVSPETVEFCKNWLVTKISKHL